MKRPTVNGPVTAEWAPGGPIDVRLTLSIMRMGRADPCHRPAPDGSLWRASLMPSGPVLYRVANRGRDRAVAHAWGPGAEELVAGLPDLLGARDRPETFDPGHPLLEAATRRHTGLRIPRTGLLIEALIPAVLHQKISGRDACASWTWLVRRHGTAAPEPDGAPGPVPGGGFMVPPPAQGWLDIPSWDWRRAGVEPSAIRTIRLVASRAAALERITAAAAGDHGAVYRAMTSLPGVGRWTAAEVGHRALGDADALSVGDYNLAPLTSHALAGRDLTDEEVEPFYEPWRPHRYRVMRLLELTPEAWPPRRGPRMSRPEHRHGTA